MFSSLYDYLMDIFGWLIVILISVLYSVYYLLQVVQPPKLVSTKDSPFTDFLHERVSIIKKNYWPTFWCVEGRAQTICGNFLRNFIPGINYRREIFTLSDGGEVALDWLEDGCAENAPCIIILPGLAGESQYPYVRCLVLEANKFGMRTVVFNNRGLGGVELKTPRLFCASNCDDLIEVVQHVKRTLPNCELGATGISMGGLILGNYLAREKAHEYLSAAKIISAPLDIHKGNESIEKPIMNHMLGRYLASGLRNALRNSEILRQTDIDMERVLKTKTIKEFDAHFTSRHFGYAHVDDYYNDATLHDKLHKISVPLLCLSAADDPSQPFEALPLKSIEECTHVAILITSRGGHMGFLEGFWPLTRNQFMSRLFGEYFSKTLLDEDGEFQRTKSYLLEKYFINQKLSLQNLKTNRLNGGHQENIITNEQEIK